MDINSASDLSMVFLDYDQSDKITPLPFAILYYTPIWLFFRQ